MSRLIVKNLPKNLTEEKLREKFGAKGVITDVQLKYTKEGTFRQFAFIGYQTEEEAKAAVDYFDKSFFNTSRINVEICAQLGDANKPRAWSKYANDSAAYRLKNDTKDVDNVEKEKKMKAKKSKISKELAEKLEKFKNDPEFLEYMEVHGKNKTAWSNDDVLSFFDCKNGPTEEEEESECIEAEMGKKIAEDEGISDSDYIKLKTKKLDLERVEREERKGKGREKFATLVLRGLPYKARKKTIKEFFRPLKADSIRVPQKIKGLAYVGFKDSKDLGKALLKDKSFINGKQISVFPLKARQEEEEENNNEKPSDPKVERWKVQEENLKTEESVGESGRIFVRNLPYATTEEELQPIFEAFGPVTEVIVPIDKVTRKGKGFALVTFLIPEHAVKAMDELDGTIFHGRMMHLLLGKAKPVQKLGEEEGSSYKKEKMSNLKKESGSCHNWNALFVDHNAVADAMAATYDASKERILSDGHAAVRLALGETNVVNEIKSFLEDSGVRLDAFNRAPGKRSKCVILAKNLPAKTTVLEMRELFGKFGVLGRVLLPPSCGVTAIVEFAEPSEARTAFKKLAYSRFKSAPLYLEWAPDDTFVQKVENVSETKPVETAGTRDEYEEPEDETILFVKNLDFSTTEDSLKNHFEDCGPIFSCTIAKRKDATKPGVILSMGYGFVRFFRKSSLEEALKSKQQSLLDGHCLELKRSNRTTEPDPRTEKRGGNVEKQTGSKILVRNIPFQAKSSEIYELFKTFGEIKNLRMPKKMVGTGSHRGFAFVEYNTKSDAKRAMESLCQSTHFYGRRLVLEWAQSAEQDIEQLRKRTSERILTEKDNKRIKKSIGDLEVVSEED